MTQEILDYLLIRSILINNTSREIIEAIDSKETFAYLVDNISQLMQQEDFLLLSDNLSEKVLDIINSYRFDYNQDKELNSNMNYIISRLHEYKMMSNLHKNNLLSSWMQQESKKRELPKCYHNIRFLINLISLDMFYLQKMISFDETIEFTIENITEYISIVNMIINQYPDIFEDDHLFLEITRNCCQIIQKTAKLSWTSSQYVKKTLKKLNANYPEDSNIQLQIHYPYQKKKEN